MTGIHMPPGGHDSGRLALAAKALLDLEDRLKEHWCPTIREAATDRILRLVSRGETDCAMVVFAVHRWLAWVGLVPDD